ncbi:hypothetical protein P4C99_21670 [Pontiellaceae bacterium B1224]|nr:hypothetical protein [Pontiellaceae bacterium B1224]
MTFKIDIIDEDKDLGEIQIGDFIESFEVCPCYWNHQKYKEKWIENIELLLTGEVSACCLTTWMHKPNSDDNYRGWILYREKEHIFIHEVLFWHPGNVPTFDQNENIISIPLRETEDEEGNEISEWEVDLQSIQEYIKSTQPAG